MKKTLFVIGLFMTVWMMNFVSAEIVGAYETIQLPQLGSVRDLDTEGLWRTYLYCSYVIDDTNIKVEPMTGNLCPQTQVSYQFEDNQEYYVRIDYATLHYTELGGWQIANTGKDSEMTISYELDVPEPPQGLFDSIITNLMNIINNIWCNLFGLC